MCTLHLSTVPRLVGQVQRKPKRSLQQKALPFFLIRPSTYDHTGGDVSSYRPDNYTRDRSCSGGSGYRCRAWISIHCSVSNCTKLARIGRTVKVVAAVEFNVSELV